MRILQYKRFARWAEKEGISHATLRQIVNELLDGLFDANLGGNVYKKRIPKNSKGKRGSYRTLIAFKKGARAIFVVGFSKNERDNITRQEKVALKRMASDYLAITDVGIDKLIRAKELIEVTL